MSKMTDYYIDLWNAAFELKSISVKWEKDVDEIYRELEHMVTSDEIEDRIV
jgi:hypothetical protein